MKIFEFQFEISLKFAPSVPMNKKYPALLRIMAWYWIGNKVSCEPVIALFADAYMRDLAWMSQ